MPNVVCFDPYEIPSAAPVNTAKTAAEATVSYGYRYFLTFEAPLGNGGGELCLAMFHDAGTPDLPARFDAAAILKTHQQ